MVVREIWFEFLMYFICKTLVYFNILVEESNTTFQGFVFGPETDKKTELFFIFLRQSEPLNVSTM